MQLQKQDPLKPNTLISNPTIAAFFPDKFKKLDKPVRGLLMS